MPPRFAYWTILLDGKPTAFRAAVQEELLPTFKRLKEKHPDAEMKWFARGKLWMSPEEARAETVRRAESADEKARGRSWRPGGSHRDPRQPYKDAKKQRNQDRRQRRFEFRDKNEDRNRGGAADARPPKKEWTKPPASGRRESGPGQREFKPWNERPKPAGQWPRQDRKDAPGDKPGGWGKQPPRPGGDRPFEARPPKKEWTKPQPSGRRESGPGQREFKPWDKTRAPFRGPRDGASRGDGPRGKGPRGPKR